MALNVFVDTWGGSRYAISPIISEASRVGRLIIEWITPERFART